MKSPQSNNANSKEINHYGKFIILPILFGLFILFSIIYISYSDRENLDEFLSSLKRLENTKMKITVNGVFDPNENEIISKLLKTKILSAHHSHPIDKIKIEIFTDKEKIMVELGRDSQNKTEYWVFYNDTSREIGRIETEYFDRY